MNLFLSYFLITRHGGASTATSSSFPLLFFSSSLTIGNKTNASLFPVSQVIYETNVNAGTNRAVFDAQPFIAPGDPNAFAVSLFWFV